MLLTEFNFRASRLCETPFAKMGIGALILIGHQRSETKRRAESMKTLKFSKLIMFKLYVILSFCQIILTFGKNYLLDFCIYIDYVNVCRNED